MTLPTLTVRSVTATATLNENSYSGRYVSVAGTGPPASDGEFSFDLHVDIDGEAPLFVVSGNLETGLSSSAPVHFIGRVRYNVAVGQQLRVIVRDFSFSWSSRSANINLIDILLFPYADKTVAQVTFFDTTRVLRFGPYFAVRESRFLS